MRIFKTFAALFLTLCVLLVSSGCTRFDNADNLVISNELESDIYKNNVIPIYDVNSKKIGSITCFNYLAFVNNSVLYTKFPENVLTPNCLEYWLYNVETNEDRKLADIDIDAYAAFYETIEDDNHLYLSISFGEFASENSRQTIYDVNLLEYTMSPILEIEGGIPYNSFTIANEKLIVAELLYNGYTDLVEYDLSESHSSVVVHSYDETDYFSQNSIRHIYAENTNIYAVRLVNDGADNYSLWLDMYDLDYNLVNSIDISDICVSTHIQRTADSKINEWKQYIAYFFVRNNLFYYQNFSTTTAIGVVNNDEVDRLFNIDALFSYAMSVSDNDASDLFIQSYGDNTDYRNIFYLINSKTHEVTTAEFFADDPLYSFRKAFRGNDKILLTMGYTPYDKGERLPERLYYLDMNDLEFKPME